MPNTRASKVSEILKQFDEIDIQNIKVSKVSEVLKKLDEIDIQKGDFQEVGEVGSIGDGIVHIYGLPNAILGELLEFVEVNEQAVVMNIEEDYIGAMLLCHSDEIEEGYMVKGTGHLMSIKVGDNLLGRVINPLGKPLDGEEPIADGLEMKLERKAPGIIYRQPVKEPLQTGIKTIDAMIPIGRGQRELIIGDRQTGKTAIAIDTIINQKKINDKYKPNIVNRIPIKHINSDEPEPVFCIYVAIGQKGSTVANIVNTLKEKDAMYYTIVVSATAADPAALQVYAPFSGATIGEYFRDTGRHALVIYDDLSKQAVAYREVSLNLRRPPGREAYPGDIFYLHSRLLERAAKIIADDDLAKKMNSLPKCLEDKIKGGGSLTALPIIETQAGDVSAYIPTNVISITDGQIFLETDLFNAGVRPAINIGISVSRVGGDAQVAAMKNVTANLKVGLAQYRELEDFSKFGGDMDSTNKATLEKGRRNTELLIQPQYQPLSVGEEIAVIYCGSTESLLRSVPVNEVRNFERSFLDLLKIKHQEDILDVLEQGILNDDVKKRLNNVVTEVIEKYK